MLFVRPHRVLLEDEEADKDDEDEEEEDGGGDMTADGGTPLTIELTTPCIVVSEQVLVCMPLYAQIFMSSTLCFIVHFSWSMGIALC